MSAAAILTINEITPDGESAGAICCYPGQVSVLRARSSFDLKDYAMALYGMPGPQKFTITLGDEPFLPSAHTFIGVGDLFVNPEQSIESYLCEQGVSRGAIATLLQSAYLTLAPTTACGSLAPSEARAVRLIAALQQHRRVLVLHDPFAGFPPPALEYFAQALSDFVRGSEEIVVVTSLPTRPNAWINNAFIARIELREAMEDTIGPGGAVNVAQIAAQLRDAKGNTSIVTTWWRRLPLHDQRLAGLGGAFLVTVGAVLALFDNPPPVVVAPTHARAQNYSGITQTSAAIGHTPSNVHGVTRLVLTEASAAKHFQNLGVHQHHVLVNYSPEIEESIKAAFAADVVRDNGRDNEIRQQEEKIHKKQTDDLLSMLQLANESADAKSGGAHANGEREMNTPQSSDPIQFADDAEWEAQREAMRQRFLESINAAAMENDE